MSTPLNTHCNSLPLHMKWNLNSWPWAPRASVTWPSLSLASFCTSAPQLALYSHGSDTLAFFLLLEQVLFSDLSVCSCPDVFMPDLTFESHLKYPFLKDAIPYLVKVFNPPVTLNTTTLSFSPTAHTTLCAHLFCFFCLLSVASSILFLLCL